MDSDKKISKINALEIYEEYINSEESIISIQGAFGSGKSTTKNILIETIKEKSTKPIYVEYDAIQYEEPSQITSQFYIEIASKLSHCNKILLNSCAVLKKENLQASHISGNFGVVGVFAGLLTLILFYLNKVIGDINDNYKLLILLFTITIVFVFKNELVKLISGLLPRYSHVKILENDLDISEFSDHPLYIFVDEIDRLNKDSLNLLLDEILTLNKILEDRKVKHKIFMFYNDIIVKDQLKNSGIHDPDFYLQKYTHALHKIHKPNFHHALHDKLTSCKQNSQIVSTNRPKVNIFCNLHSNDEIYVPSSPLLVIIDKYIYSFRDLNMFIIFLKANTNNISRALSTIPERNKNFQFRVDALIIQVFLDYRFKLNLANVNEIEDIKDLTSKKALLELNQEIFNLYNENIVRVIANALSSSKDEKSVSDIKQVFANYKDDSRIYPSEIIDSKVNFNLDSENDLENVFRFLELENNGKDLIKYIKANLSEFSYSRQSQYPYLHQLRGKRIELNESNLGDFHKKTRPQATEFSP